MIRQLFLVFIGFTILSSILYAQAIIIDHQCTDITKVPQWAIEKAKTDLHIGYGHTSHGSQITTGMTGLVDFANNGGLGLSLPHNIFQWNNGGTGGALDLEEGDGYGTGWLDHDAGYFPDWVEETREYLEDPSHADVNVIMWSWCGQLSWYSESWANERYLDSLAQLEQDYPGVTFVYMTGHADGTGEEGTLHKRNRQIRQYCIDNNKVLFDFYDIECFDPWGNDYSDNFVDDGCNYDSNGDQVLDSNWATEWQDNHTEGVDWYNCESAHSEPLNANQKAYAAWWMWARLAGWDGTESSVHEIGTIPNEFLLYPPTPNPFNPRTQIRYNIPSEGMVRIAILNMLGQEIKVLFDGSQERGEHGLYWNGKDENGVSLSSGVYFCQIQWGGHVQIQKMMMVR